MEVGYQQSFSFSLVYVSGKPCPVQTSGNEALVHFVTDAQNEFTGFRLRYTVISPEHRYSTEGRSFYY